VFLALALLMLGFAYFRKRLFLGVVMALYGLSMFNLPPNWGFGIPYLLAGAWLLVRAYRLQRELKVATGELPRRWRSTAVVGIGARAQQALHPPTSSPRRSSKPNDEKRAADLTSCRSRAAGRPLSAPYQQGGHHEGEDDEGTEVRMKTLPRRVRRQSPGVSSRAGSPGHGHPCSRVPVGAGCRRGCPRCTGAAEGDRPRQV